MTGRATGHLQGDDLIGEVLHNMEEGLFRIRHKTLVPAIYRIYLNSSDYEPLRDVVPFIAGEIRTVLDEKLASWNGSRRKLGSSLLGKIGMPESSTNGEYVRLGDSWIVEIYPDLDGQLQPGEIEVHSELGAPPKSEYGAGSLTRRIFPREQPKLPEPAPDSAPTVATGTSDGTSEHSAPLPDDKDQTKGRAFAYLHFADQQGPQTFEVTKNQ